MKKRTLILLFFSFCCTLYGQDSMRVRFIEDTIRITAFRPPLPRLNQLDSLQKIRTVAMDLGRSLEAFGLANATHYGPPGTASLLRIRGTSPDHAAVVWNGLPLQSVTLGMADCSLIPSFFFDHIQLKSDPADVSSAASAIGGGIQLGNQTPKDNTWRIMVTQESNTLRNHFSGIEISGGRKNWYFRSKAIRSVFSNRFFYTDTYRPDRPRVEQNSDKGNQWGWMQQIIYRGKKATTMLSGWSVNRSMQLPNIMGLTVADRQFQQDNQQRVQLLNEYLKHVDRASFFFHQPYFWSWKNSLSWLHDEQFYQKQSITEQGVSIQSAMLSHQLIAMSEFTVSDAGQGMDASLQSYMVQAIYDHKREVGQFFPVATLRIWKKTGPAVSSLSSRYERRLKNFSTPSLTFSEDIALHQKNNYTLSLHFEAAKKIRIPDLNELYWQPGGNPTLKPEESLSLSPSLLQIISDRNHRERLQFSIEGWRDHIKNWIQWLPGARGIWSPVNYKQVRSTGIESAIRYTHYWNSTSFIAQVRYQYVAARGMNQNNSREFTMVYQPTHSGYGGLDIVHARWNMSVAYHYTGSRFTTENNAYRLRLSPYYLINVSMGVNTMLYHYPVHLRIGSDNLLNQPYESVRTYAMPGRIYSVSLSVSFTSLKIKNK